MNKRLALAIVIALVVYVAAEQRASALTPSLAPMANPDHYFWLLAGVSAAVFFLAAFAGSWVARARFLVPALLLWAIATATTMIVGYRLQLAADPITSGAYFLRNLPMLSATLTGTLSGVFFGRFATGRKRAVEGTRTAT